MTLDLMDDSATLAGPPPPDHALRRPRNQWASAADAQMTVGGWRPVEPNAEAERGVMYRTTWYLNAPYNAAIAGGLGQLIREGCRRTGKVECDNVEVFPPGQVTMRNTGRFDGWAIRVYWHKVTEGTPFVVVLAAIAGLVAVLVGAWWIVGVVSEKQFRQLSEDAKDILATLLSPAVIIGVVTVFLAVRAGKR